MTTSYTPLLGLALPVTGELAGVWGDTVSNYITKYLDSAVAGVQTISGTQTAVTLSVTNGSTLSQAGALGTTGSAQYQIINCTGNPAGLLTITVPAQSKVYLVLNATSTSQSVKVVGTGPTTGVTIISGEKALVAWNGSDFVKVATAGGSSTFSNVTVTGTTTLSGLTASTALALDASKNVVSVTNTGTGNNVLSASPTLTGTVGAASLTLSSLTSGRVTYAGASGLLQDSANLTFDGTSLTLGGNPTLSAGTANGVLYLNASKVATSGSALTFDGTTLKSQYLNVQDFAASNDFVIGFRTNAGSQVGYIGVVSSANNLSVTSSNSIIFNPSSSEQMRLTSTGLGVGTSSPSQKLHVVGTTLSYATQSQIWDGATGTVTTFRYNGTPVGDIGTGNQTISGGSTGDFALSSRAGNLIFGINTAEKMRLDTAGNVGIGTSSPGDKLTVSAGRIRMDQDYQIVWQNAGTNRARVYGDSGSNIIFETGSSNTEGMRLTSTGLGIGTSSPYTKLTVNGNQALVGGGAVSIPALSTALVSNEITSNSSAAGSSDYGFLRLSAGGGASVSYKAAIDLQGYGTTDNSQIRFYTAGTQRAVISYAGNVTINAPASGTSLAVTAVSGGIGLALGGAALACLSNFTTGAYHTWQYNGTSLGDIGTANNTFSGGSTSDFGVTSRSGNLVFGTSSTERMRLDSSGNLGIGTSSPAVKLDVNGSVNISSGQNLTWGGAYAANIPTMYAVSGANGYFYWSPRGNTGSYMTLDANSNLGLGVTPSAWASGAKALQIKSYGALYESVAGKTTLTFNSYESATNTYKYLQTEAASMYQQVSGVHYWLTAPSGTAGNAISFTQALTLHASGGLSLGNTSDPGATNLSVSGTAKAGIVHLGGNYTAGATTPSVTGISYMPISNSSATTITNFTGAVTGQIIYLYFADANTTINRANARLAGSTNFTSTQYATLALLYNGTEWIEICRSTTNG